MRLQILNILKELGDGKAVTENDMIDWANKKVENTGLKIENFKDKSLGTGVYLCQLCCAINPKACNPDLITPGDSKEEAEQNAKYAISVARKIGATGKKNF
jgi:plastin-1